MPAARKKKVDSAAVAQMSVDRRNDPRALEVTERIQLDAPCGWCMTSVHKECKPESAPYFGKVWLCGCKKCFPALAVKKTRKSKEEGEDTENVEEPEE